MGATIGVSKDRLIIKQIVVIVLSSEIVKVHLPERLKKFLLAKTGRKVW